MNLLHLVTRCNKAAAEWVGDLATTWREGAAVGASSNWAMGRTGIRLNPSGSSWRHDRMKIRIVLEKVAVFEWTTGL